jgi:nitrogen fixation protein FixH
MNLLISIFGGMIVTAALYFLGRLGRLSNFWAAVAAAALPTVAYLVYAIGRSPSLDTVTMHVIAYPTVAVLLGMLNGSRVQRGPTMHWAPKLLIGFFLLLLTVLASFVYIAGQGLPPALAQLLLPQAKGKNIHTGFAGVVEHQQEAAKGIAHHRNMEAKLAKLGWQVDVVGLNAIRPGTPVPVSVHIVDRSGGAVDAVDVRMALARPGQPADNAMVLTGGAGEYHGTLAAIDAGAWVASLSLANGQSKIVLEHTLEVR